MTDLMTTRAPRELTHTDLAELADYIGATVAAGVPENTRRAYEGDWRRFTAWCARAGADPMPATPQVVTAYVGHLAKSGRKYSTIRRAVSSIARAHARRGEASPTTHPAVGEVLKGFRRALGTSRKAARPVWEEELRQMLAALADDTRGKRDRALLVLGFLGAFRRSELVGLDVDDVRVLPQGLVVRVKRSKTDQDGAGTIKRLPRGASPEVCPVEVVTAWLTAAGLEEGPLFRGINRHAQVGDKRLSTKGVARVVKGAAERAGLEDPDAFSGHSLRRGAASSARRAGADRRAIERMGGWAPGSRVVDGYIDDVDGWDTGAAVLLSS